MKKYIVSVHTDGDGAFGYVYDAEDAESALDQFQAAQTLMMNVMVKSIYIFEEGHAPWDRTIAKEAMTDG